MGCGGLSYDEALAVLQEAAEFAQQALRIDSLPLYATSGQISAKDVYSTRFLPPFDNSAMDGFAVSSEDTLSASEESPVRLSILGSIAAGDTPPIYTSEEHKCYRINTGAPFPVSSTPHLPRLFDACARIEIVHFLDAHTIELREPVKINQHRRSAGEDFQPGMALLKKGQRISPEDIAVLASNGISHVKIVQQPRIAILTTGKELKSLEDQDGRPEISGGQIFNSNGYYLRAALEQWGYSKVTLLDPVGDDPRIFQDRIREEILADYDVLITTGGVSKGEHDYVKSE
jgi:molybdopterin molybdotransferase